MNISEKEKLKKLLDYWIEHNKEHGEEFKEWAEKAEAFGEATVCEDLLEAAESTNKANEFLLKALGRLTK